MTKGKGDGSRALQKAFQAKEHRERGQTALRKRFGMLEKKKDYKTRAKSYKNKREKLADMRLEAAMRNPDEFNTAMINTETDEHGRHMRVEAPKKGPQQRRENAANARYLKHKSAVDGGVVKQLRGSLSFMGHVAPSSHQVFIDEDEAADFNAAKHFNTVPELLDNVANRATLQNLAEVDVDAPDAATAKEEARAYLALTERLRRKAKLDSLVDTVAEKQKLLKKGKRVLTPDVSATKSAQPGAKEKQTYRWLYERKR